MNIFVVIFFLFLFPNIVCGQNEVLLRKELPKYYNLNDSALQVWRADSNGCKNLRGQYARSLIDDSLLIGMPVKIVLLLFGNPNGKIPSDDAKDSVYVYWCETTCNANNKVVPNEEGYMASIWVYFIIHKEQVTEVEMSVP
jgi:hypothetical protein